MEHPAVVKRRIYILNTADKEILCHPNNELVTCYMDASFVGEWAESIAHIKPDTAHSSTGFVLSQSLREVIATVEMWTELKESKITSHTMTPNPLYIVRHSRIILKQWR
jgi:hypothetical protein